MATAAVPHGALPLISSAHEASALYWSGESSNQLTPLPRLHLTSSQWSSQSRCCTLQVLPARWLGPVIVPRRAQTPSGDLGEEQALSEPRYVDEEGEEEEEHVWLGQLFNYFGSRGGFESIDLVRTPAALRARDRAGVQRAMLNAELALTGFGDLIATSKYLIVLMDRQDETSRRIVAGNTMVPNDQVGCTFTRFASHLPARSQPNCQVGRGYVPSRGSH